MYPNLTWFTTRLALLGLSENRATEVIQVLQEELLMRPHLRKPQVKWSPETQYAIVQVDTEDFRPESAAKQVQEEMLESLAAVLWETEGIHFEILEVYPSQN
jgi:hypothetical protein